MWRAPRTLKGGENSRFFRRRDRYRQFPPQIWDCARLDAHHRKSSHSRFYLHISGAGRRGSIEFQWSGSNSRREAIGRQPAHTGARGRTRRVAVRAPVEWRQADDRRATLSRAHALRLCGNRLCDKECSGGRAWRRGRDPHRRSSLLLVRLPMRCSGGISRSATRSHLRLL